MAKRAAVQVNIVGRDGNVGPPVFLTSPHHASVTSSSQCCKEIGSSASSPISIATEQL